MWREAAGVCLAEGRVAVALLRRRRDSAIPELAGWCVKSEQEWLSAGAAQIGAATIRPKTSLGLSLRLGELFVRSAIQPPIEGSCGVESLGHECRRELQTSEPLCVDVVVCGQGADGLRRLVAVVARQSALERCRGAAGSTGGTLTLVTPELLALFSLLAVSEPAVASARVALLHAESERILVGIFEHGVPEALRELSCMSHTQGFEAAMSCLGREGDLPEALYVSGLPGWKSRVMTSQQSPALIIEWDPIEVIRQAHGVCVPKSASLALPIALALCALEPDASHRNNLVRQEGAQVQARWKRVARFRLGARIALGAALILSGVLMADTSFRRTARAALKEEEAVMLREQIGRSSRSEARRIARSIAEEIEAADLLPLQAGESLRPLISALPEGIMVSHLYFDSSTVEMSGSSDVYMEGSALAEAVSQIVPGALVQVTERGEFTLRGARPGAGGGQ